MWRFRISCKIFLDGKRRWVIVPCGTNVETLRVRTDRRPSRMFLMLQMGWFDDSWDWDWFWLLKGRHVIVDGHESGRLYFQNWIVAC